MKVIAFLLALAATAIAEQYLYAEVQLYNEKKKESIGRVLLRQLGENGYIAMPQNSLVLLPGSFKAAVAPEKIVGHSDTWWPEILPDSPIELFKLTVGNRKRTANEFNKRLTLGTGFGRISIIDHALILYKSDVRKKTDTVFARGIVRRWISATLSSTHNPQILGIIGFLQYKNVVKIQAVIDNLPVGSYSIVMRKRGNSSSNQKSLREPIKLLSVTVKKPRHFYRQSSIDESTGIKSLDEINGYIEIHKNSGTSDGAGDIIASGQIVSMSKVFFRTFVGIS